MITIDGEKVTPKQKARDMMYGAVTGRLYSVLEDLDNEYDPDMSNMTDREREEVERHLQNYLERLRKMVAPKPK